jgi:hypothetical protein
MLVVAGGLWGAPPASATPGPACDPSALDVDFSVEDLNTGGFSDVVVGVPHASVDGPADAGVVDIHHPNAPSGPASERVGESFLGQTPRAGDGFGAAVADTDVDAPGYLGGGCEDLVIGAPGVSGGAGGPASAARSDDPPGTVQVGPVPVSDFSLSPYRLVDDDARPVNGVSVPGTYNTTVTTTDLHTGVGATGTVHRPTAPGDVKGSGTTTAYLVGNTLKPITRVVRTPHGSTTIRGTMGDRWFSTLAESSSLSGNRYVYGAQEGNSERAYLFDASTGRRTLVQRNLGYALPGVFGDYLASLHTDGSVWRRNLVTGVSARVSQPLPLPVNYGRLFMWGDYVGWNIDTGDDDEGTGPSAEYHGYRDAKTMAPAHSFSRPLQQLSSAGVVLRTDHLDQPGQPAAYDLTTYDGATVPLLPSDTYRLGPQVEGRTMAWADPDGLLKVAQLDLSQPAPRYLGAPFIPTTRINDPTPSHYWRASLPYSAPVSSCHMRVLRGGRAVLNLGCGTSHGHVGVADLRWNAIGNTGHRVPAGTYRYQVTAYASDQRTAALNADGDPSPVTGSILVGHATRTVLRVVPTHPRRGSAAVLSAQLTTTLGSRHAHRRIGFYRQPPNGTWQRIRTLDTRASGTARLRVDPRSTVRYRAEFAGSVVDRPSSSRTVTVRVR